MLRRMAGPREARAATRPMHSTSPVNMAEPYHACSAAPTRAGSPAVARTAANPRFARWLRAAVLAVVPLGLALACGPSVQSIHEGSVRFEHCYRLDLDLDIAPGHREACWK